MSAWISKQDMYLIQTTQFYVASLSSQAPVREAKVSTVKSLTYELASACVVMNNTNVDLLLF